MKNDLLELGDTFLKRQKTLTKVDLLSKMNTDNPIIALLFLAHFHPSYNQIMSTLTQFYYDQNSHSQKFEIIFCSCDDTEAEYSESISEVIIDNDTSKKFSLPWLIIPYEKKEIRQKLIEKYYISNLPKMIIFDKTGTQLISLNKSEIDKLDKFSFDGWVNISSMSKKMQQKERYRLGDKGNSVFHPHNLVYADNLTKMPEYRNGGWNCDECGKSFAGTVQNFYCALCGYDICDNCYEKE